VNITPEAATTPGVEPETVGVPAFERPNDLEKTAGLTGIRDTSGQFGKLNNEELDAD
jgi:hypothetical protein